MTSREPIQIVEIVQPFCSRTFGTSPCTATGTACYNTRATCKDADNFDKGSLSLYFSRGNVADRAASDGSVPFIPSGASGLVTAGGNTFLVANGEKVQVIPSLVSVSTVPCELNLAGSNSNLSGLGRRATVSIKFRDHPHSDRVVDPYRSTRGYDPATRGSFWTKWLRRNKYRYNITLRVYDGLAGQSLSEMTSRSYILTDVSGPDSSGSVTIKGKDIMAHLEEDAAQCPEASPGELEDDIGAAIDEITILGGDEDDYPETGTIRIDDECITYTGRSGDAEGLTFTGCERGTDGTEADEHSAEAAVQRCVRFGKGFVDEHIRELLTTWGGIAESYIDDETFDTETQLYLTGYQIGTLITEPEAVYDLLCELMEQVGCSIWWDDRAALIKMKAVRGVDSDPPILSEETNLLAGSVSLTDLPDSRVSQVWFYFAPYNYVDSMTDSGTFERVHVDVDPDAEGENQYGEASIRKIYSRWVTNKGQALSTASKILKRYRDTPREASFSLDWKDADTWTGDDVRLSHYLDVDDDGQNELNRWTIISAEGSVPGHSVTYTASETTPYGKIVKIQEDGAADYPTGASEYLCFIGDEDGLLSDGSDCGAMT